MTKLITVFGATGNQGGSVVRAILNHPQLSKEWKIRGVTRSPDKPDAQAMVKKGVEMVAADLNSPDSILKAITGSDAVFGVTNYWEKASLTHELQQGQNLTSACLQAKVPHLIWSSLPHVSKITNGKLSKLHHFDSKALVEEHIREKGQPASFVLPGFFMANVPGSIKPTTSDNGDGEYTLTQLFHPDTKIPMLDVAQDFGKFVAACLLSPEKTMGKHVLATSCWATPLDLCQAVEKVTGKKCTFVEMKDEEWKGGEELRENMDMIKEWMYYGLDAKEGVEWSQGVVRESGVEGGFGGFEGFLRGRGFGA